MRVSGRRGESVYNSRDVIRGPSFGGVGHRMSIVGPHAAPAVIDNDDDDDDDCRHSGGASCSPPPVRPILPDHPARHHPAGRRSSLLMSLTAVDGGGTRVFGAWLYPWWRRKVRAVVLIRQVLIQPGVDDGGKRSGVTLVGLRGRHCQAGEGGGGGAVRATVMTTTATEEGG